MKIINFVSGKWDKTNYWQSLVRILVNNTKISDDR
jgi:hypothetical protein